MKNSLSPYKSWMHLSPNTWFNVSFKARTLFFVFGSLLALSITTRGFASSTPQDKEALRLFLIDTISDASSFNNKYDAEVWLVRQSSKLKRYIKDPKQRLMLLKKIHRAARQAELNPDLVLGLIQIESAFNQYAISRVGAQGLMQVMPFWKREIGRENDNLTDVDTNLSYGCRILQFYMQKEQHKGGLKMALARYHGSYPKTYYSEKVMNAWKGRWESDFTSH